MQDRPTSRTPIVIAAVVALAVAAWFGWRHFESSKVLPTPPVATTAPADPAPPPAPAPTTAPTIQHPVDPPGTETAVQPAPLPALAEADALVRELVAGVVTSKDVVRFLQMDGFIRRVVATVDNLPREQAPLMVWPVYPTPQRFTTQRTDTGVENIHPDNSQRYTPFVQLIESVDSAKAVAVYRRLYPLFQQAYEELGFPGRYFNDRLVQVLDHLIATPVQTGPLAVTLVEVKGEVPSTRPWVRYEFADPALQSMSAGHKMLMRTGAENHQRLRARLIDIRARVASR
ncbi:DUF3014 domain-containing protein [Hydrogenophaga sp. IBVHS1]|uniref:DUF3014 domain-containing protein n=1 Tax=unclassified Hydrogenophaga TaxID=2610897 RepID=UPI000A2DC3B8|nr:DUF3014 domain-containing protein [Hydrogenophaga sp. IBVHS1]OSZ76164.1 hypothetical protein CAP37_12690 [Hydrogenophaga sp. IBVHS1]